MAFFSDILKGLGKYATVEGRDQAQNLRNLMLALQVKRVKPEDYNNPEEYNKALGSSNEAFGNLQSELVNPSANKFLNDLLGVTPAEQGRQGGAELYGYSKAKPRGKLLSPAIIKDTLSLASKTPQGASKNLLTAGIKGALGAGSAALGMSTPGNELKDTLIGLPVGFAGGSAAYGLGKLGGSLVGKIKPAKPASDQLTKSIGLSKKAIEDLGGWNGAKEFAGEFTMDAKKLGLNTSDRYARANSLKELSGMIGTEVDDLLNSSEASMNANKIIETLDTNDTLKILRAADNETYNGILSLITDNADEAGNIPVATGKKIIEQVQKVAGGFKNTTGDQSAIAKQILTEVRSVLRDNLQEAIPEAGNLLSKWSRYIKVSPSITSDYVSKTAGLSVPGTFAKIGGTGTTKINDFISNLLTTKPNETMARPSVAGNILETLGIAGRNVAPTLMGAMTNPVSQPEILPEQLGADDPGMQAINSAFSQPQQGGGQRDQLKQALTIGILSGQISATEANAISSLLGIDKEEGQQKLTEKQRQFKAAGQVADEALSILESGAAKTGKIQSVGSVFGKFFGTQDPMQTEYLAKLDGARMAAISALSGANVPPSEYERMRNLIPEPNDEYSVATQKLRSFKQVMDSYAQNSGGSSVSDPSGLLQMLGL